jgi:hypothetical protein
MSETQESRPQAEYQPFDGEAEFQRAVDRLLAAPGRELRVFDPNLSALRLNDPERVERLKAFLLESRTRRLFIALHDPVHMTRECCTSCY